ncbi:hypothetical protein DFH94DRAFT_16894 [Russula ochroleuca]|uniref:Uncharacterized protein n=1 Tax=Russula ochroleuca TaxID=152965 RepID=A0A9P5N631_9AGAM|nr:hypothetical protein DFH94DRAFT_16894 [Russula ochroleuca]
MAPQKVTDVYSYNFPLDGRHIKLLVYSIFFLESVQTALSGADLYYYKVVDDFRRFSHDLRSVTMISGPRQAQHCMPCWGVSTYKDRSRRSHANRYQRQANRCQPHLFCSPHCYASWISPDPYPKASKLRFKTQCPIATTSMCPSTISAFCQHWHR